MGQTRTDKQIKSIRSTPVYNWYLIYRPRKDERQSRPRRNSNSEHNSRRNTTISPSALTIEPAHRLNNNNNNKAEVKAKYIERKGGCVVSSLLANYMVPGSVPSRGTLNK